MHTLQPTKVNERAELGQQKYSHFINFRSRRLEHQTIVSGSDNLNNQRFARFKTQITPVWASSKTKELTRCQPMLPIMQKKVKSSKNIFAQLLCNRESQSGRRELINESVVTNSEGVRLLADINPRINRIKLNFLRRDNRSTQKRKERVLLPFKRKNIPESNRSLNLNISLSCQSIAPLSGSCEGSAGKGSCEMKEERTSNGRFRYGEIPPEQFIYQHKSSILTKGIIDKISKIMRKTQSRFRRGVL